MGDRHTQYEHRGESKVEQAENNAFSHRHRVISLSVRCIGNRASCPELRTGNDHKEEQPGREIAIEPRPNLESDETKETQDPEATVYSSQHSPTIKRDNWDEIKQVHKKAKVREGRPDAAHLWRLERKE